MKLHLSVSDCNTVNLSTRRDLSDNLHLSFIKLNSLNPTMFLVKNTKSQIKIDLFLFSRSEIKKLFLWIKSFQKLVSYQIKNLFQVMVRRRAEWRSYRISLRNESTRIIFQVRDHASKFRTECILNISLLEYKAFNTNFGHCIDRFSDKRWHRKVYLKKRSFLNIDLRFRHFMNK